MVNRDTITYVVTPSVALAEKLRELATPFVRQGLVRQFLVVPANAVMPGADPQGRWAGADAEDVGCLAAVAQRRYATVRTISLQVVPRGSNGDSTVVRAGRALRDRLADRLAARQNLVFLNVLVPDDEVRGLPLDLLDLHATANIVVAPEDRASPERASHALQEEWRRESHALVNLFAVAGLWTHQEIGSFDELKEQGSGETPHVTVVRSFGRIVRAFGLVESVADTMFEQRTHAAWAATAVNGIAVLEAEQILAAQTESFLTKHGSVLTAQPATRAPRPEIERVGILRAFAMMIQFIIGGLKALPSRAMGAATAGARRVLGDIAQEVVFGVGSAFTVKQSGGGADGADQD